MLLSALDPALLIYQQEHWETRQPHVMSRLKALTMHRSLVKRYGQQIGISNEMAALVYEYFPWNTEYKAIAELLDLRTFIFEDLAKAHYVSATIESHEILIEPGDLTCVYVDSRPIEDAWKELLHACIEAESDSGFDAQVATWEEPVRSAEPRSVAVKTTSGTGSEGHYIPLVWDDDSWARRMDSQDSWPDLQLCVELYFKANSGMQNYPQARELPAPFECTESFWKSVDDFCHPGMRQLLVKAIAKRVYGILDSKLHDEPLGNLRRLRVNYFWRVHYVESDGKIIFVEFGPHDIGGV